jgi:hypothetical protein
MEGTLHIGHSEINNVSLAGQHFQDKAFSCSACLLNFYSHIPISMEKQSVRRQNTW